MLLAEGILCIFLRSIFYTGGKLKKIRTAINKIYLPISSMIITLQKLYGNKTYMRISCNQTFKQNISVSGFTRYAAYQQ